MGSGKENARWVDGGGLGPGHASQSAKGVVIFFKVYGQLLKDFKQGSV